MMYRKYFKVKFSGKDIDDIDEESCRRVDTYMRSTHTAFRDKFPFHNILEIKVTQAVKQAHLPWKSLCKFVFIEVQVDDDYNDPSLITLWITHRFSKYKNLYLRRRFKECEVTCDEYCSKDPKEAEADYNEDFELYKVNGYSIRN